MKFILPIFILLFTATYAYAASMSNSSYILDVTNDTSSLQPTPNPKPTPIKLKLPNNSSKVISGNNYVAYLSYDDDGNKLPLVFTNSSDALNFGKIVPGEPLIRTQSLTVLPGTNHGYQVLSYEDHVLQQDSASIPDTSCDSGNCTQILSDLWQNPLTYGFGYRCDNVSSSFCALGFEDNEYKRFANESVGDAPTVILSAHTGSKAESVISYKLNIGPTQTQKAYQNIIYYITVPSL